MYEVALGSKADVDKAVVAARRAFETFSQTSREDRVALLSRIIEVYRPAMKDIGTAVSDEMGAPLPMAEKLQAGPALAISPQRLRFSKTIISRKLSARRWWCASPSASSAMITAVELALEPDRLQGGTRARRRLHHDPEAERIHAVIGADFRGNPP